MKITGYGSKSEWITESVTGRRVLHLGAVGETCGDTEFRVREAPNSLHAKITSAARQCIGIDHDQASVSMLTERGIFDNLLCADVTKLQRTELEMEYIDCIVVGDTIEHLSNPGDLLDSMHSFADPKTKLLITTPNALGLMIFLRHWRGQTVEGLDHVCSFNQFSLKNLLHRHGWKIERLSTCYQDRAAAGKTFKLGRALFERNPILGGTLYAVCSRR